MKGMNIKMKKYLSKKTLWGLVVLTWSLVLLFPETTKAQTDFKIYSETQLKINEAIAQDKIDKDYLNEIISLFNENIHTNSDDLNEMVLEALEHAKIIHEMTNEELSEIKDSMKLKELSDLDNSKARSAITSAKMLYITGTELVKSKGCPQTAAYMRYAMKSNPETYYSKNDDWAKKCALNSELFKILEPRFETEIMAAGKTYGTLSGTFAYTTENSSLDQYTALHKVNYSVTFAKQYIGYSAVYNITDVYDFDWGKYDNFAIGFGNNYCYAMQSLGLISPFKISIVCNI